jgi:hypothetical protein
MEIPASPTSKAMIQFARRFLPTISHIQVRLHGNTSANLVSHADSNKIFLPLSWQKTNSNPGSLVRIWPR